MLAAISAPIATPIKTLTTNNIHTSVTTADTSARPTNATRFSMNTRRRPILSARSPKNNAPIADPKNAAACNQAISPLLSLKWDLSAKKSPLITIRSYASTNSPRPMATNARRRGRVIRTSSSNAPNHDPAASPNADSRSISRPA
jgi:hypothetical protein